MNLKTNEKDDETQQINESEEKIDLLSEGYQPESIDAYAPQIILSPLTSTLHYQEINHSTFSPELTPLYDILDKSSSFRDRWKKFRSFFHHYPDDNSNLLIDFYNSAKEWNEALNPFLDQNVLLQLSGNHWNFFKLLLLPTFDEFFQTIAVLYAIPKEDSKNANKENEPDFKNFIDSSTGKESNVMKNIIRAYKNIFMFMTDAFNNQKTENNKNNANKNTDKKGKNTEEDKKGKNTENKKGKKDEDDDDDDDNNETYYNVNDTLHEILVKKRIDLIIIKYFQKDSDSMPIIVNENLFISIPTYTYLYIPTELNEMKYKKPKTFQIFLRSIIKSLPLYQRIFSHLSSAIPIIKHTKEPISFLNDTEKTPVIDILGIRQSKMTFRYFLYAIFLIKNFHSIIHVVQSYYSMRGILMNPQIIKHLNSIYYQQFKLTRFIMKYEEHFQLLVRRNISIFLYYLRGFRNFGENFEKKNKPPKQENEEEKEEKEKTYFRYDDDFNTLSPELDIDNEKDKSNDQKNDNKSKQQNPAQTTTKAASEDDNALYLRKLKSLVPSLLSNDILSTSSSMFSSILMALCYKTKFLKHRDEYLYQWPIAIDFRNTLAEFSDYSFLYAKIEFKDRYISFVKQMILYATLAQPPKKEKKEEIKVEKSDNDKKKENDKAEKNDSNNKKEKKEEIIKYAFDDPENMNFLSLFSIYDSALVSEPENKEEIEKEAEELLNITLKEVAKCLIGCNDIIVDVKTTKEKQKNEPDDDEDEEIKNEEEDNIYTRSNNNINNRFIDYLSIKSFQMLGKLYQIGTIISKELNDLFYEKLNEIIYISINEGKISNSIKNLRSDRLKIIVLNTRHEFLVSKGAILDPFETMYNKVMLILQPGQIESRFSVSWSKRIVKDIINKFLFNIDDSNFINYEKDEVETDEGSSSGNPFTETKEEQQKNEQQKNEPQKKIEDQPIRFGPIHFFNLLKITPYGGATHYIKNILKSLNNKLYIDALLVSMNEFQCNLNSLFPCPIQPYGPDIDIQFRSYKSAVESMKIMPDQFGFVYRTMGLFGNHLGMLLILDLASEVDQSNHTTFQWYIQRSVEASAGKQACSYIFDESWLNMYPNDDDEKDNLIEEEELKKRSIPHSYGIDSKSKYFDLMIDEYRRYPLSKDSQFYSKKDRKAEVDINSSLIEGISHFQRLIRSRDDIDKEKTINMINVMLFYIVLEKNRSAISGGFLLCAVALLKALDAWDSFKVDSVIHRLCYQLKNYKNLNQKGSKKKKMTSSDKNGVNLSNCNKFLFKLFYQLELCDYYV